MSRNQRALVGLVVLVALLASLYWDRENSSAEDLPRPVVVQGYDEDGIESVLDFTLKDLNGSPVSLSDYEDQVVYLNFWATWCKWCKKEMPDIERIHQAYKDRGVAVLTISVGEEADKVNGFIREHGYSFPVLLDPEKTVAQAYHTKPIPVSLFIGRDGKIAFHKLGYMNEEQMVAQLEPLLEDR